MKPNFYRLLLADFPMALYPQDLGSRVTKSMGMVDPAQVLALPGPNCALSYLPCFSFPIRKEPMWHRGFGCNVFFALDGPAGGLAFERTK